MIFHGIGVITGAILLSVCFYGVVLVHSGLPRTQKWSHLVMIKKIIIAIAVLIAFAVAAFIAAGIYAVNNVPEGIVLNWDYPDAVVVGDEFDVTITVINELDERRQLGDLSFYSPLLDGASIVSFDPAPAQDQGALPFIDHSVSYNRSIKAEDEFVIVVTMIAEEAGVFSGDVEVTIDGMLSMHTTTQTLVIEESDD
tara:strand:- start:710 stop:1300 length:591 start_codon:yes stop_codon:yes gene_type:complete